jgi:hypothetical protein
MIGRATVRCADPATFARNSPSLFADPVAWLICAAFEAATGDNAAELAGAREDVGLIVISEFATTITMRSIAEGAGRGRVSPLRFAGANPAVLAGLACIRWGLRGPSLTLSMRPADGVAPAAAVARGLLSSGAASHVGLVAHAAGTEHVAACVIVGGPARPVDWPDVCRYLTADPA